jgi:hypothetical protein
MLYWDCHGILGRWRQSKRFGPCDGETAVISDERTESFFYGPVREALGGRVAEEAEVYVLGLLVRMSRWDVDPEALAVRVLGRREPRIVVLQEAGDEALFVSGWFPEHLKSRGLDRSYYTMLGSRAYRELSCFRWSAARVYAELSKAFNTLQRALEEIREACSVAGMDRSSTLERWLKTRSVASERRLAELCLFVGKSDRDDT